jgi:hypothetical protein
MARSIPRRYRDEITIKKRIRILNQRNELDEEVWEVIGVNLHRRAGRLKMFELILGNIEGM